MKKMSAFFSVILLMAMMTSCAPAQKQSRPEGSKAGASSVAPAPASASAPISKPRKVAVYVTGGKTPNENEMLNARITHALVSSGKYNTIERSDAFLEQVAKEMVTQRSGAIDDNQISKLGQQAGADFVCIGKMVDAFGAHQISARIVNVVSVEVIASGIAQGRLQTIEDFAALSNQVVASLLGEAVAAAAITGRQGQSQGQSAVPASGGYVGQPAAQASKPADPPPPPITGTLVPGDNLTAKLAWLHRSAESHNTYIIDVNADETIAPQTFHYKGTINITIVLRGDNIKRTIRLQSNGTMFTVGTSITFILDNNITLQGHPSNNRSMVYVGVGMYGTDGGIFRMQNGSSIIGNAGGGVSLASGTFEMNGGSIIGNTASEGGGVCIVHSAIGHGTFIMTGGIISGNTAWKRGGGVYMSTTTFKMRGGTIAGNTAREYGAGLYVSHPWANFTKSGGTIIGYSSDQNNGNVVRDDEGNVLARRGHAVYADRLMNSFLRKETTTGPGDNLSAVSNKEPTGAWE